MHVVAETPVSFLQHLKDVTYIERKPLRFCAERLTSLVRTLELTDLDDYAALQTVAGFATLVATYERGLLERGLKHDGCALLLYQLGHVTVGADYTLCQTVG